MFPTPAADENEFEAQQRALLDQQARELRQLRMQLEKPGAETHAHPLALEGKTHTATSFNVDAVAARNKER